MKVNLVTRLTELLPHLKTASEELLEWESSRAGGGHHHERQYRKAADYYAMQVGKPCSQTQRVGMGCLVLLRTTPFTSSNKAEASFDQLVFLGPLSDDEHFAKAVQNHDSGVLLNRNGLVLNRAKGEAWSESSHSRDENHSKYQFLIVDIAAFGPRK